MSAMRTIEIDTATADELEARAATRGMSVGQMVAELVALGDAPVSGDAAGIAELDRQWAEIEAGAPTVPHDKVARWLDTWGTPAFRPWHNQ